MKKKPELVTVSATQDDMAAIEQFDCLAPENIFSISGDYVVAKLGDRVVGYAEYFDDVDEFLLLGVCVAEEYRGRGIAKKLFNECVNIGRNLGHAFMTSALEELNDTDLAVMKGIGFTNRPEAIEGDDGVTRYYFDMIIGDPANYSEEYDLSEEPEETE